MKRIATANRAIDKFGPGKDGFNAAVPGVSDPTYLSALFCESLQESIVRTIETEGMTPGDDHNQLEQAIKAGHVADYATLRAYGGTRKSIYVTGYLTTAAPSGIAGLFTRDDSDTTSADNGGTIIVASNGKRWKRSTDGTVNVKWFGATCDGVTDDIANIQSAITSVAGFSYGVVHIPSTPGGCLYTYANLSIPANVRLIDWNITAKQATFAQNPYFGRQHQARPLTASNVPLATSEYVTFSAGFPEAWPCFDKQGFLWVPLHGSYNTPTYAGAVTGRVAKVDTLSGEVVATITFANKSLGIYCCHYDHTNDKIWVSDYGSSYSDHASEVGHIYVINPNTNSVVSTVAMATTSINPSQIIFDPSTSKIMVTEVGSNKVTKYDPVTYAAISSTAALDNGVTGIAYCPVNGDCYVTCYVTGTVVRVDGTTMAKIGGSISTDFAGVTGGNPVGIVYEPRTRSLWTGNNVTTNATKISPVQDLAVGMATGLLDFDPFGMTYDPKSEMVIVSNYSGSHNFIDPVTATSFAAVDLGANTSQGSIVDPFVGCLWSMDNGGSRIRKILIPESPAYSDWDATSRLKVKALAEVVQNVAFATPLTIDASKGSIVMIAAMTSDLVLTVPINPLEGQILKISFVQDSTGGRTVYSSGSILGMAAGTGFVQAGNTANKRTWVNLIFDGSNWLHLKDDFYY